MVSDVKTRLESASTSIKKQNMSEEVLECLMQWIMDGTLQMGDKLPSAMIADKLNVSRMPVREAMNMLEKKGIAVSVPNVGMRLVKLSDGDVNEIYHIRRMLEPDIAYYACMKTTLELIRKLKRIHREYQSILYTPELNAKDVHLKNREFHFTIYQAADMPREFAIIQNLWDAMSFFKMIYGESFLKTEEGKRHMIAEHQSYIDAMENGQAEKLRQAMGTAIEEKLKRYQKVWNRSNEC
jgi:DNA-binding GntR family transcriptional regulator